LIDIESWELDGPEHDRALATKSRLNTTFAGAAVQLITSNRGLDRYGRIRGHVNLPSGPLADYLVANGMAWRVKRAATPEPPKKSHDVAPESTISTPNV
jgi:endonuclease YncB( thermonuclease family)